MSLDLKKLRNTDNDLQDNFQFWHRLKFKFMNSLVAEEDFGKVESVTIAPAGTAGSAARVAAARTEKSMGQARVTSTRLVALKTYLDEPA